MGDLKINNKRPSFINLKFYKSNPEHPAIAMSYSNLGVCYSEVGECKKAIEYFEKALDINKKTHAKNLNHPNLASCYSNLGSMYCAKGEIDKAITIINHHFFGPLIRNKPKSAKKKVNAPT